jgi:hypothetical protein
MKYRWQPSAGQPESPAAADLITLHVYSPPLPMNAYSLLDARVSRFIDPINDEFLAGAGI